MITFNSVLAAREAIEGKLHRTPLVTSSELNNRIGAKVYLKLENIQKTGSFKARGVLNMVRNLSKDDRQRGLITASSGNHAQALAWAAAIEKMRCTVVMPESAPKVKFNAARGYGANVILEQSAFTVIEQAQKLATERNYIFVHPFDDPFVVAGQGTVGLEICQALPQVDLIVIPVGGGTLLAGTSLAVKNIRSAIRVVGVEPIGAASMWRSRQSGHPVRLERIQTIADGLSAPFTGDIAFDLSQRYVDDIVTVNDASICASMKLLLERCKVLAEPAGATALAALLDGTIAVTPIQSVVVIVSGGNIDLKRLAELII